MGDIPVLKVKQWLPEWENVIFDKKHNKAKPLPHFYIFRLGAHKLKRLTGIQRRDEKSDRQDDLGIQRKHDEERSKEITKYVQTGYPYCDLSAKKNRQASDTLRKPGWLPTSIVVNVLGKDDVRRDKRVHQNNIVDFLGSDSAGYKLILPKNFNDDWEPEKGHLYPLEVIDGQHRLWAFEEKFKDDTYELPVVAFHGLDISWQAYLFWIINIKPKRINSSLAFDMYPLLRYEDWLDADPSEHPVYRETRAQEIVNYVYILEESPWHKKINMLGDRTKGIRQVSQNTWVRGLSETYLRPSMKGTPKGGLFGGYTGWSRAQQIAFIVLLGNRFKESIDDEIINNPRSWISKLGLKSKAELLHEAFYGDATLISTDQGIRALLKLSNDFFVRADHEGVADFVKWADPNKNFSDEKIEESVKVGLIDLKKQKEIAQFVDSFCKIISKYDWRTFSAPGLTEEQRQLRGRFRGAPGYKELTKDLLKQIKQGGTADFVRIAEAIERTFKK